MSEEAPDVIVDNPILKPFLISALFGLEPG